MDPKLKEQLVNIFGQLAVAAGEQLQPAYGAAIARMGIKEALALATLIQGKKWTDAQAAIRTQMTAQELADEKSKLADLTFDSAVSAAQGWSFAEALLQAGLKVLLALALGAVGL
jgi:hypothetical protein